MRVISDVPPEPETTTHTLESEWNSDVPSVIERIRVVAAGSAPPRGKAPVETSTRESRRNNGRLLLSSRRSSRLRGANAVRPCNRIEPHLLEARGFDAGERVTDHLYGTRDRVAVCLLRAHERIVTGLEHRDRVATCSIRDGIGSSGGITTDHVASRLLLHRNALLRRRLRADFRHARKRCGQNRGRREPPQCMNSHFTEPPRRRYMLVQHCPRSG